MGCSSCGGGGVTAGSGVPRLTWTVTMPDGVKFADGSTGSKTFLAIGEAHTAIAKAGQAGNVSPKVTVA